MLIFGQEHKFCAGRRHTSPVPLMRRVNSISLFAKKGISLVSEILDNLRASSAIFYAERAIMMNIILVIDELRNAILTLNSMRWLMGELRRRSMDTVQTVIILSELLQELEFVGLW